MVIPAGEGLKSSLVMVSVSAAAAFEAQSKGRQLGPAKELIALCSSVSELWDGEAIKASTKFISLLIIKHSIAQN